jgi:hypothetical protein
MDDTPQMEHYIHGDVLVGFTIFGMVTGFTLLFVLFFALWCCCCPPLYVAVPPIFVHYFLY